MSGAEYPVIAEGVWPTMITPMKPDGAVDFKSLDGLVDWFIEAGVTGLFAVCQSSEMFDLDLAERVAVAERVIKRASGRTGVIVSGNTGDDFQTQKEELSRLADVGADALVLVVNRYAAEDESDARWRGALESIVSTLPDALPLGLYECPYPYHRIISDESFSWLVSLGRFGFLKDTSCDPDIQRGRSRIFTGSSLRAFNANSATLYSSLHLGYSGYSGVMANFHPELYVWLCSNFRDYPAVAENLQAFLSVASVFERQGYPLNAKYHLKTQGILEYSITRKNTRMRLTPSQIIELAHLRELSESYRGDLPEGNAPA